MKIKTMTMGILIFIIIFGGIGATIVLDLWSTTTEREPVKYKKGEFAGSYNPVDIRGSYTFADVARLFEIDIQVLYNAFNIPNDTDSTKIKTKKLEEIYAGASKEIGNESVQIFVALYKNLPIELDDTFLTKQAVELIMQENKNLTAEQKNYLSVHTLNIAPAGINISTEASDTNEAEESLVKGNTTFQMVIDEGIDKEEIEQIINAPMPSTNKVIKDYCISEGLSFSEVKEKINELIK